MIDTVMKWLEDNPVGIALSVVCGVLVLALIAMTALSSLSLTSVTAETAIQESDANIELPLLPENQPIDTYAIITQRPLFNESRQPVLDMEDENLLALDEDALNMGAPEVELAGVIITPSLRMVTLRRKDTDLSLVAFEGKPIEADFGTWQVSRIDARAATLTSANGEELQLEMKVHDVPIEAPPPIEKPEPAEEQEGRREASAEAVEEPASESAPLSRAEEIRQRIEERREELKREAEEADQGEGEPEQPGYENAIQSLIRGGRKPPRNNENEQQRRRTNG